MNFDLVTDKNLLCNPAIPSLAVFYLVISLRVKVTLRKKNTLKLWFPDDNSGTLLLIKTNFVYMLTYQEWKKPIGFGDNRSKFKVTVRKNTFTIMVSDDNLTTLSSIQIVYNYSSKEDFVVNRLKVNNFLISFHNISRIKLRLQRGNMFYKHSLVYKLICGTICFPKTPLDS